MRRNPTRRWRASTIALMTAGGAPTAPASPAPLTPSGLAVEGTLWPHRYASDAAPGMGDAQPNLNPNSGIRTLGWTQVTAYKWEQVSYPRVAAGSASGRFCCRSPLMVAVNSDSVALARLVSEAGDDGAAQARAGAAFLRVLARRSRTGRSTGARDCRRARSVLGPR